MYIEKIANICQPVAKKAYCLFMNTIHSFLQIHIRF